VCTIPHHRTYVKPQSASRLTHPASPHVPDSMKIPPYLDHAIIEISLARATASQQLLLPGDTLGICSLSYRNTLSHHGRERNGEGSEFQEKMSTRLDMKRCAVRAAPALSSVPEYS